MPDETDIQLALIAHQGMKLVNPEQSAEQIADALDALFAQEADPDQIAEIQESTSLLLGIASQYRNAFEAALAAALALNKQRQLLIALEEDARRQLETLCEAVASGDHDDALSVSALKDRLEDELFDSDEWGEVVATEAKDTIYVASPLEWEEVELLWRFLTGGEIEDSESGLWQELLDLLDHAEREMRVFYQADVGL